jgi:hypothetical protein
MEHKNCSLPPHVEGPQQGVLDVHCHGIFWNNPKLHEVPYSLRLLWWGYDADAAPTASVPLNEDQDTNVKLSSALRSSRPHVLRYLQDAGFVSCTVLRVGESSAKVPFASGDLDLSSFINETLPSFFETTIPLQCSSSGVLLGNIQLKLEMTFFNTHDVNLASVKSCNSSEFNRLVSAQSVAPPQSKEQEACMVTVTVDSAIFNHLPMIEAQQSVLTVYAGVSIRGRRADRQFTRPTGCYFISSSTGYTAAWENQGIAIQIPDDTISHLFDDAERRSHSSLVLQVWQSADLNCSRSQHERCEGNINRPAPLDQLIGCATVDLHEISKPVGGSSGGSGVNTKLKIVNSKQEVVGFLKVALSANDAFFASCAGKGEAMRANNEECEGVDVPNFRGSEEVIGGLLEDLKFANLASPQRGDKRHAKDQAVRYAWSGSDSDDDEYGMDAVGIAFQGAVSCSDGEEAVDEEGSTFKPTGRLINEDWFYDISKTNINVDEITLMTTNEADVAVGNSSMEENNKAIAQRPIVFKNTLLPGVVNLPKKESHDNEKGGGLDSVAADGMADGRRQLTNLDKSSIDLDEAVERRPPPATPPHLPGCDQYNAMDSRARRGTSSSKIAIISPTIDQIMLQHGLK